jgi:hypothetical protein
MAWFAILAAALGFAVVVFVVMVLFGRKGGRDDSADGDEDR